MSDDAKPFKLKTRLEGEIGWNPIKSFATREEWHRAIDAAQMSGYEIATWEEEISPAPARSGLAWDDDPAPHAVAIERRDLEDRIEFAVQISYDMLIALAPIKRAQLEHALAMLEVATNSAAGGSPSQIFSLPSHEDLLERRA